MQTPNQPTQPHPPAAGVRLAWDDLPERVRAAVAEWLDSPILAAESQPSGFSPGVAARLRAADGRRVFVKAVSPVPNAESPRMHRREARIVAALPADAPVARLLWSYDEGEDGWIALVFEDIAGQHPALPWQPDELARTLDALGTLAEALTPSPVAPELAGLASQWGLFTANWWQRIADWQPEGLDDWSARHAAALADLEDGAPAAIAGETLLHLDLRADNILLTPERVVVVDWPHARIGAAWLDLIGMAPSVAMQGGPEPEELLARHRPARGADPTAISAAVAVLAGYFTWQALRPAPPGLPTLRAFQAAQGAVARRWLATRTGLD